MKKILVLLALFALVGQSVHACLDANGKPMRGKDGQLMNDVMKGCGGAASVLAPAKEVKASHILVGTEKEAKELKAKIDKGESFEELAKKYSQCPSGASGGDLGWFSKGMMVKEFETSAFSTPEKTVTEPVKTQFGWHLIKVYGRK